MSWSREQDGRWLIVNVQKSAWTGQQDVAFTINLTVAPIGEGEKPPPYYECRIRKRIGGVLDDGEDKWWTVASEDDIDRVGAEVVAALEDKALPWFDRA